jgi:hypothetical protein
MFYNEKEHKENVIQACIYNLMGYELPMPLMKNDGSYVHPIDDIYVEDEDFYKCYEIARERFNNLFM